MLRLRLLQRGVKVVGQSMYNPLGKQSFDDGDIILCDPERQPVNGSLVVVRLPDKETATFKKLYIEDDTIYLKALNSDWCFDNGEKLLKLTENYVICGVVFQRVTNF